jgi:hypothetical protein
LPQHNLDKWVIMAIRDIQELAEHNFRSLEEIERYLEELKKQVTDFDSLLQKYQSQFAKTAMTAAPIEFKINVKQDLTPKAKKGPAILIDHIDKFVIPKMDVLRKNFQIVDELYEDLDKLRSLESTVSLHFKSKAGSGKTLEGIKKLKLLTEQKVRKALEFLEKVGTKHEPTLFKTFVQKVADRLEDEIDYKGYENIVYVHETVDKELVFTHYLKLIGVSDDEGSQFKEIYVVFTCVLTPSEGKLGAAYYVNTLYEFATPGKFDRGTVVDSVKAALAVIGIQLDLELNFSSMLGTLPMNLDMNKITKNLFTSRNYIQSVSGDENLLEFTFTKDIKTEADASKVAETLYPEVRALQAHSKGKLKVRLTKDLGRYKVIFKLANVAGQGQVSVDDLRFLRDKLGVDEDRLRKIVRIINGGS